MGEAGLRPQSPPLCEELQATLLEPPQPLGSRDGQVHTRSSPTNVSPAGVIHPFQPTPLSHLAGGRPSRMRVGANPAHFRHADGSRRGLIPVPPPRGAQSAPCAPPEARTKKVGSRRGRMRAAGAGAGQLSPAATPGRRRWPRQREQASLQVSEREGGMEWGRARLGAPPGGRKKWGRGSERASWEEGEAGEP